MDDLTQGRRWTVGRERLRDFLVHPIVTMLLGVVLGFAIAKIDQRGAEKTAVARKLTLAKYQVADALGALHASSPVGRADLERFIEGPVGEVTDAHRRKLDDVATTRPETSRLEELRSDDLVNRRAPPDFISSRLPTIVAELKSLARHWPSPGDRSFPYAERVARIRLFISWIDSAGAEVVGQSKWHDLENSMSQTAEQYMQVREQLRTVQEMAGNIIDETPMTDMSFRQLISRVKAGRATFFLDFALDAAFKKHDGKGYQYQGQLADRNKGLGYMRGYTVPDAILKFETLESRDFDEVQRERERIWGNR